MGIWLVICYQFLCKLCDFFIVCAMYLQHTTGIKLLACFI
uniref:Uncharacterized protein n=1 Tax=Anguilla anguilla TaxID=7936 RepID=A0A0E9SET5_ANGAN